MAVSKRRSTDEPLTEHDLAERLDHAALRVWRILYDIRENLGKDMVTEVKRSRYHTNVLDGLRKEIDLWYADKEEE